MYHLVYISHASGHLSEAELVNMLHTSRLNNKKRHITGMLVYLHERFIQVLEGSYEAVNELYEQIRKDSRHHKVSKVLEGNTEHRIFNNWSMGFKKLDASQFESLSGYKDPEDFFTGLHVTNDSPAVLIFLSLFYKKNMSDYPEEVALGN